MRTPIFRSASIFTLAFLVAGSFGFGLPQMSTPLGLQGALAVTLCALALFGLGLQAAAQYSESRQINAELSSLRDALRLVERVLSDGRADALALKESVVQDRAQGNQRVNRVVAEVRLLQTLIERLSVLRPEAIASQAPAADHAPSIPPSVQAVPAPETPQISTSPRPGGSQYGRVGAAPIPSAAVESPVAVLSPLVETLREALKLDRVDVYLQPIVSLPQRKPRYYECYSRIRDADGAVVYPEAYLPLAEQAGLVATIDNIQLFRCMQLVRRTRRKSFDTAFFCNLSVRSLADGEFFKAFLDFLEENRDLASGLIFEFNQADEQHILGTHRAELGRLAELGYRFSLDRVTRLDLDAQHLADSHIRFVKIDAATLLEGTTVAMQLRRLKTDLTEHAIDLIVSKIEREHDLIELLDSGIDFGQGYLFGEPRLSRAA